MEFFTHLIAFGAGMLACATIFIQRDTCRIIKEIDVIKDKKNG